MMPKRVFYIHLLGPFELTSSSAGSPALEVPSPRRRAIIAYLAMQPEFRETRERLATLLWGDADDRRARQSLRQALLSLREDFDGAKPSPLLIERDVIGFDPAIVQVDARALLAAAAKDASETSEADAAIYRGPFLEGIDLPIEGFDEWLARQRDGIARAAATLFRRAIAQTERVDGGRAIQWATRLVDLDPDQEDAQLTLIRLLFRHRGRDEALSRCLALQTHLQRELGVPLSSASKALFAEIRKAPFELPTVHLEPTGLSLLEVSNVLSDQSPATLEEPRAVHGLMSYRWRPVAAILIAILGTLTVGWISVQHSRVAPVLTSNNSQDLVSTDVTSSSLSSLSDASVRTEDGRRINLSASHDAALDDLLARGWAAIVRSPREGLPNGPAAFFEAALQRAPDNTSAQIGFAASQILPATQLMDRHGEFDLDRAGDLLNAAVASQPQNARALMYRAMLRRLNDDLPGARDDILRSISADPSFANGYGQAGHIFYRLGDYERGLKFVNYAMRLSADSPSIGVWEYTAGMIYIERREDELAATWFERAKGIIPQSIYPRLGLIAVKALRGDAVGAQAERQELHAKAPWVTVSNLEDCLGVQATPVNTRPRLTSGLKQAFGENGTGPR